MTPKPVSRLMCMLTILCFALGGCGQKAPPAQRPFEPTLSGEALDRLAVEAAGDLAVRLPQTQAVRDSLTQLVLAVAPVEGDGSRDSARFGNMVRTLHGRLSDSGAIREAFVVVQTSHADARDLLNATNAAQGPQMGPVMGGSAAPGPSRYPAESIYVVRGRYDRAVHNPYDVTYHLAINVVHPQTGRTIYSNDYRIRQVWDSRANRWVEPLD